MIGRKNYDIFNDMSISVGYIKFKKVGTNSLMIMMGK